MADHGIGSRTAKRTQTQQRRLDHAHHHIDLNIMQERELGRLLDYERATCTVDGDLVYRCAFPYRPDDDLQVELIAHGALMQKIDDRRGTVVTITSDGYSLARTSPMLKQEEERRKRQRASRETRLVGTAAFVRRPPASVVIGFLLGKFFASCNYSPERRSYEPFSARARFVKRMRVQRCVSGGRLDKSVHGNLDGRAFASPSYWAKARRDCSWLILMVRGDKDLNLHEFPHQNLNLARLPIPPRPHALHRARKRAATMIPKTAGKKTVVRTLFVRAPSFCYYDATQRERNASWESRRSSRRGTRSAW